MSSAKNTTPYKDALCIMLARDDHVAGFLLAKIVYWSRYGKARIPKYKGYWVAHKRDWWEREARLSVGQYNRASSRLAKWGLIEKTQWWFGRVNILYVRPTTMTNDFLAIATTWEAADEFLPDHTLESTPETADLGKANLPISKLSNENAGSSNPSLSKKTDSNNIKNIHNYTKKNKALPCVSPASPPYAKEADSDKKEKIASGEIKNNNKNTEEVSPKTKPIPLPPSLSAPNKPPTVKQLAAIWVAAVSAKYGSGNSGSATASLTAKQLGALATFKQSLRNIYGGSEKPYDLEHDALDMVAYVVTHWGQLAAGKDYLNIPTYPDPYFLPELDAINPWIKAKYPSGLSLDDEPIID
jgi:hypothetical protein